MTPEERAKGVAAELAQRHLDVMAGRGNGYTGQGDIDIILAALRDHERDVRESIAGELAVLRQRAAEAHNATKGEASRGRYDAYDDAVRIARGK
jgi:hypothetical protein